MNGRDVVSDRDKAVSELKNNETLGVHSENLISIFKGDPIQLAQFALLLLFNQLLSKNEELTILIILCQICMENNLNNHLTALWDWIRSNKEQNHLTLFNSLFLEKGFLKVS